MTAPADDTIDTRPLRETMGSFANGIAAITIDAGGATHGLTANAFKSGSLHPPLCVVSIAGRAHRHKKISKNGRFGASIHCVDKERLAFYFACTKSLGVDPRFAAVEPIPFLSDRARRIGAPVVSQCDRGDHTLFLGDVLFTNVTDRPPPLSQRCAIGALPPQRLEKAPVPEYC